MQAKKLPAARGWIWLIEGFRLWRRNPGLISSVTMATMLLLLAMGSLPVLGSLLTSLALPFASVILIRVCHHVVIGARSNPLAIKLPQSALLNLLILGVCLFACLQLSELAARFIAGTDMEALQDTVGGGKSPESIPIGVVHAMLFQLVVAAVLVPVMWFAPMLSTLRNTSPAKALFFAVVASWRNKGAFLVLALALMGIVMPLGVLMTGGVIGQSIGIMLSIGILCPVLNAAINYLSLVDIFGDVFRPNDEL